MFARSFARMTVTSLIALFLTSNKPIYSAYHSAKSGRQPSQQQQPPQPTDASKDLRLFIEEEDLSSAQMLKRDLEDWTRKIKVSIIFVDKESEPYDLRIILASGSGKDSGSCAQSTNMKCMLASCEVTIKLFFVSAVALTPDGKLQFTEIGVGKSKIKPIAPLATKLAKRFSVISGSKVTSAR